jgi:hypothetical protein
MRPHRFALIAALCFLSTAALAAKGVVTHRVSSCDYFVVQTANGYALLEWYGGNDPDKGDVLVGDFEAYGMKDVFNITSDDELRVWVEEYWLPRSRVLEKLVDKCR